MSTPFDIFGVIETTGLKLVAALYLPAGIVTLAGSTILGGTVTGTTAISTGATVIYMGLTESPAASSVYGGTAEIAGTALPESTTRPYSVEVRTVAGGTDMTSYSGITSAFAASTTVVYGRDVPETLGGGFLVEGTWGRPAAVLAAGGDVDVTDNGDGSFLLAFKVGATTIFSKTFNPTTGVRS